ncbi:hypothetical protein CU098_007621 [Rhizopus stolonifer]|uniref:Uncharacterized protein n=1 Tax=Rhizopus stolonifer TaxID=4846 RepID=A0A367J5V7_RHIST|nr:hypothetical protein CU098_007621 [Rhizopus stolonifer]
MSFKIPGYFLDQKTKKLYKIQPHGPFSLPELRKRIEREEEEARKALASTSPVVIRTPLNIRQFLHQRATGSRLNSGLSSLLTHLQTQSKLQLQERKVMQNRMFVEMTGGQDNLGEMFMTSQQTRLSHYGYQLDPQFSVWQVSHWRHGHSFLSLNLSNQIENDGQLYQTLVGSLGGSLCRFSLPKLPAIINEEAQHMFLDEEGIRQNDAVLYCPHLASYMGYEGLQIVQSYDQRKDMFWSSNVNDEHDQVVIGGDQKVYQLSSSTFQPVRLSKVKSSVFATHIPAFQPKTCWIGQRNGQIKLMDNRHQHNNLNFRHRFQHASSVVRIQSLSEYMLLSIGIDGSIHLWDTRRPGKTPFHSLKGHINESTLHLGSDIDLENNLLMLSGNDGRVRIWSIVDSHHNQPIWTSEKYDVPVPAVKFMCSSERYPRLQDCWPSILPDMPIAPRYIPGVLLFGTSNASSDAIFIDWLTATQ